MKEAVYIVVNFYTMHTLKKALLGLRWSGILEKLTFVQLVKKFTCLLWNLTTLLFSQEATTSECCSREIGTPTSYLRGDRLKSQVRDLISWLRFSIVLSSPYSSNCWNRIIGHRCFPPYPVQFVISCCHSVLYSLSHYQHC